ncbi:hypothetical protein JCM1841_001329 [Sporobolomyces salmonicolor]
MAQVHTGVHHQDSPARLPKRPLDVATSADGSPSLSTSPLAMPVSGPSQPKRRITRKRAIMSCRQCTTRKIRCEREGGPGTPCKACEKRGEGNLCDSGSTPAQVAAATEPCADHRADLERRVAHLEAVLLHHHRSNRSQSSADEVPRPKSEAADSETEETAMTLEDAAMTLEDIAVSVRVSQPQIARHSTAPLTPYGAPAVLPAPVGASREYQSLIVPPISKRWRGVLEDLYSELPPKPKMDYLISHYFANVAWFWVVVHEPTFLAEYDAFHQLLHDGRGLEVDPLWLGTLFLVLAHSANSIDYLPPGCDFSYEEITGMFSSYFEAGRAALDCGDCGSIARIRTVQVVALFGPLALNSGDPGRVDVLIPYVAATVRLCQQLRLDKLGSDPNRMPDLEDPALPSGTNSLRRELAIRAFQTVSHLDQMIFRCRPTLPVYLIECAMPGNFDDRNLRPDKISTPAPPSVRTIATYETVRFRVGIIQREYHDTVVLDPNYAYSSVLKCDTEMRNLLDEYDLERPEPNETTPQFWARIFALQNVNIRLIRFHRPFMSRGYREATYRKSTDAALAAARMVLETQKELDRTQCPLVKDCYQLNHIQIAVVVLFAQIWHEHIPETHVPTADYRLVTDASLCFHRALSSVRERVRNVARQSLLVVQCMFESLHAMSADQRKESFAQLLKRITAVVADAERRAASMNGHCVAAAEAPAPCIVPTPSAVPPPPSSGPVDARSLLLNVPTPVHAPSAGTPYFPKPPRSASDSSHAPHDLHFGDLTSSDWGFDWMTLPQL